MNNLPSCVSNIDTNIGQKCPKHRHKCKSYGAGLFLVQSRPGEVASGLKWRESRREESYWKAPLSGRSGPGQEWYGIGVSSLCLAAPGVVEPGSRSTQWPAGGSVTAGDPRGKAAVTLLFKNDQLFVSLLFSFLVSNIIDCCSHPFAFLPSPFFGFCSFSSFLW